MNTNKIDKTFVKQLCLTIDNQNKTIENLTKRVEFLEKEIGKKYEPENPIQKINSAELSMVK